MKREIIILIVIIVFSFLIGYLGNDLIIGGSILTTGLLCSYYASNGKKINYVFGFINYLLMAYVSYKNNLYGMLIFYTLIFAPLQIKGLIEWNKEFDKNQKLKIRKFTLKNSIIIVLSCLISSCILAYLLHLIPTQRLAFLDALSNCINLWGVILMILRFRESWWVWLANNIIDVVIWAIVFIAGGIGSFMMLAVSIGFLLINIYGIISWNKDAKLRRK